MSKRTLFLIFALFLITFVLLMIALYQPQAPKTSQVVTVPKEPIAQSVLSFGSPVVATSSSASTLNYSLLLNIQTLKNKVTAVQLELQYDPAILNNVAIVPGSFFANPVVLLNQVDSETGRISYAVGIPPEGQGVVGNGTVANFTFSTKAKVLEKTAIIFLPKTLVTAEGISESVLQQSTNGLFTVGSDNSTPSAASQ
jgi:hypothetical protein